MNKIVNRIALGLAGAVVLAGLGTVAAEAKGPNNRNALVGTFLVSETGQSLIEASGKTSGRISYGKHPGDAQHHNLFSQKYMSDTYRDSSLKCGQWYQSDKWFNPTEEDRKNFEQAKTSGLKQNTMRKADKYVLYRIECDTKPSASPTPTPSPSVTKPPVTQTPTPSVTPTEPPTTQKPSETPKPSSPAPTTQKPSQAPSTQPKPSEEPRKPESSPSQEERKQGSTPTRRPRFGTGR